MIAILSIKISIITEGECQFKILINIFNINMKKESSYKSVLVPKEIHAEIKKLAGMR